MPGLEEKILAITFSLSILAIVRFSRVLTGTYLMPAGLFSICWFIFTIVPLTILAIVPINSFAILYIALATLLFSMSAAPFNWRAAITLNKRKISRSYLFDTKFLRFAMYASIGGSIFFSLSIMMKNGFTIDQIMCNLIETSGQYATQRATNGIEYGLIGMFGTLTTYLSPVLGGLINSKRNNKWMFALSISPSLFTMVIQSSKLVFLVAFCFYISGALIGRIFQHQLSIPKIKNPIRLFSGITIVSALILISFVSRFSDFEFNNIEVIIEPLIFSIASYTLGQIYAFSDFFSFATNAPSFSSFKDDFYSFGAYTLNSIFAVLSMGKDFPPGMYEESGWYSDTFETNIFTFFRGLIYDFGVVGSLIFLYLFGLLSHFIAYRTLIKRKPWAAATSFIAIIVFILMSYLFSVFVARYSIFTCAVLWLLLRVNSILNQTRQINESHTSIKAL